jgi:radical SAM domain protein|nr:MAG TPA: radical SAM peptide maturase, CXXX-repeat target family [Caudoviricetes sp.]
MITNLLEKTIQIRKPQFEKFILSIFKTSKMERLSLDLDAISFRTRYMIKHGKDLSSLPLLQEEFTKKALELRNVFGIAMRVFMDEYIGYGEFNKSDLIDVLAEDVKMDSSYITFNINIISNNIDYLNYIDEILSKEKTFNLYPNEYFRFYSDSYNDGIAKAYPELFEKEKQSIQGEGADQDIFVHSFTFQTSENCSLSCTYCYQINKSPMKMTFDIAKKFVDDLLHDKYDYINQHNSPAIILEFIGGEPLMEIDLTRKIYEYFLEQCYELNHPWFTMHRISICSNGLQYFNPNVQSFFKEYSHSISFNISIDGNKKLHDACRIQPNGEGSYDIDMMALQHYTSHYVPDKNSKMTLAPGNIKYLFESVKSFMENGMKIINLNCVFEPGWTTKHATIEYEQLKELSNYILENDLEDIYISIFNERPESVGDPHNDNCSCGGQGRMLALRANGEFYPCLRYMPSSVSSDVESLQIGDVSTGPHTRASGSKVLHKLDRMTRRSGMTDLCFECPISSSCGGCLAVGHQIIGTPDRKTTFHCVMKYAEALANWYYFNNLIIKHPNWDIDVRQCKLPKNRVLKIISEDEYEFLKYLEIMAIIVKMEYHNKGGESS